MCIVCEGDAKALWRRDVGVLGMWFIREVRLHCCTTKEDSIVVVYIVGIEPLGVGFVEVLHAIDSSLTVRITSLLTM